MRTPPNTFPHWTHRLSALFALLLLTSFWTATFVSEIFLDVGAVVQVKRGIALGLLALVPCMAALHFTGKHITRAQNSPLIARKRRLLRVMGANAALVLVPSALTLWWLSRDGTLEPSFYVVQALELVAGIVNVTLLLVNVRAGLKLAGRLRRRAQNSLSTGAT
jgi:hypothetical protein